MTSFGKRNSKQMVAKCPRARRSLWGVSSCQMLVMEVKLT
jgi:hypothetical protein